MTNEPPIDAHILLDTHPSHPSAVTATVTGSQTPIALMCLEAADWTHLADNTLVLVRIDHEEPYWAQKTIKYLTAAGITVEVTPRLQDAIDEEWTWANYPTPWSTRSEIRKVSNRAQKLHDDIRRGRLLIHAHAHDGHTTVAVGTYRNTGVGVHLHGENHLRQVADTFGSTADALRTFAKAHGSEMTAGPAPLTDTERDAEHARSTPLDTLTTHGREPARPQSQTVPSYAADAGDHDALLDAFFDAHDDWHKWRTWSDEVTHAVHETQTLRIERIHDAPPHEIAWTVAAYSTPVSDRAWVLTASGATPAPVLQKLLDHLAECDGWDTAIGTPIDAKSVTAATRPLSEAGWTHTIDGRWLRWTSPTGNASAQFDIFAAQHPTQNVATWTIQGGPGPDPTAWTLTASPHTPSSLLADLSETLAHETGTRRPQRAATEPRTSLATSPPAAPAAATGPAASRSR